MDKIKKPDPNHYNFGYGHNMADQYHKDLLRWQTKWIDADGREVEIKCMSNYWLNNIRKMFKHDREAIKPIMDEIKRRKTKHYERSFRND